MVLSWSAQKTQIFRRCRTGGGGGSKRCPEVLRGPQITVPPVPSLALTKRMRKGCSRRPPATPARPGKKTSRDSVSSSSVPSLLYTEGPTLPTGEHPNALTSFQLSNSRHFSTAAGATPLQCVCRSAAPSPTNRSTALTRLCPDHVCVCTPVIG